MYEKCRLFWNLGSFPFLVCIGSILHYLVSIDWIVNSLKVLVHIGNIQNLWYVIPNCFFFSVKTTYK
jgi:hypothetical protein